MNLFSVFKYPITYLVLFILLIPIFSSLYFLFRNELYHSHLIREPEFRAQINALSGTLFPLLIHNLREEASAQTNYAQLHSSFDDYNPETLLDLTISPPKDDVSPDIDPFNISDEKINMMKREDCFLSFDSLRNELSASESKTQICESELPRLHPYRKIELNENGFLFLNSFRIRSIKNNETHINIDISYELIPSRFDDYVNHFSGREVDRPSYHDTILFFRSNFLGTSTNIETITFQPEYSGATYGQVNHFDRGSNIAKWQIGCMGDEASSRLCRNFIKPRYEENQRRHVRIDNGQVKRFAPEYWIPLFDRMEWIMLAQHGIDPDAASAFGRLLYFSVVNLTTLGYGDIVPLTSITRALVGMQSILGIIFAGLFLNSLARSRVVN